ncbi:MAG TPA: hypothetical protein PKJ64_02005 [bacterium]|nr:hypothetical protein [bacterium]HMY35889.1 hypothetical protein [bacterium]HNB09798.1 hypothetical protein [bacterium]HNB57630.1 hypothetical protein [bacterium]HNF86252.1 hypothetical protein [bacterium]
MAEPAQLHAIRGGVSHGGTMSFSTDVLTKIVVIALSITIFGVFVHLYIKSGKSEKN